MNHSEILIIGAGVSGLYAASLLERAGISYRVLEGRDRIGGRVLSSSSEQPGTVKPLAVDLGPGWVWPDFQPQLSALLGGLGVRLFPQHEQGDMLYERSQTGAPQRLGGYTSAPVSMRLAGGMRSFTDALAGLLPAEKILTSHRVTEITYRDNTVQVSCVQDGGQQVTFSGGHILLALPPGLASDITFDPPLPASLHGAWRSTATWMAPHAKYVAVYNTPFWRAQGLSGDAQSGVGPMVEIHDASSPESSCGALFGFIGIPAKSRQNLDDTTMKALCRAQLIRLFGPAAGEPVAEYLQDWFREPFTASERDLTLPAGHTVPPARAREGVWQPLLTGIGSEWSAEFPGYLAGAVDAAAEGVGQYLGERKQNQA